MDIKMTVTVDEMKQNKTWDQYCKDHGIDGYSPTVLDSDEITLSDEEAKKYGFLGETWK